MLIIRITNTANNKNKYDFIRKDTINFLITNALIGFGNQPILNTCYTFTKNVLFIYKLLFKT